MHVNGCRDKACLVSTVEYARRGGLLLADFSLSATIVSVCFGFAVGIAKLIGV